MFTYRVLNDSSYNPSPEDKNLALEIRNLTIYNIPDGMEEKHFMRNAAVFKGMTMDQYINFTK